MATHEVRDLFRRLSMGVYVVGVSHNGRANAFTAAWITQVSFDPLLVALTVNPHNFSHSLLTASGAFAISVLKQGQLELARRYGTRSGRDEDKLAGQRWRPTASGAPVLLDAAAWLDCRVLEAVTVGDHELVVAQVTGGEIFDRTAEPLIYAETGDLDGSTELYPPSL